MTGPFTRILLAATVITAGMGLSGNAYAESGYQFCKSYVRSETHGSGHRFRAAVAFCAEVASFTDGWENDVDIEVIGPNLVSVVSLGDYSRTTLRLEGAGSVLGVVTSNGGETVIDSEGTLTGSIFNNGGVLDLRNDGENEFYIDMR